MPGDNRNSLADQQRNRCRNKCRQS